MPRVEVHRIPKKKEPDFSPLQALGLLPMRHSTPRSTKQQVQSTKKRKNAAKQARKRNRQ